MLGGRRILLVLLCAAHLGAALSPCPPSSRPVHPDSAHADPCHELTSAQALSAPCPCGCGGRSGPAPVEARLGVALLASPPATAPPEAPAAAGAPSRVAPQEPPSAIDPVPRA